MRLTLKIVFCILISLVCFSCAEPFALLETKDEVSLPSGKGYFSPAYNNMARNVLPSEPHLDSAFFVLDFSGPESAEVILAYENREDRIILAAGTYTVNVTVYLGANKTNPVLYGSRNDIIILAGMGANYTIELFPRADGITNGMFEWNVTLPSGLESALMSVIYVNNNISVISDISLLSNTAGNYLLPTGYYRVLISFIKDDTHQTFIHREALHIYHNLTSKFERDFGDTDFNSVYYEITFNDTLSGYNNISNAYYGGTVNNIVLTPYAFTAGAGLYRGSVPAYYQFDGWYYGENKFYFNGEANPTAVIGNITLEARWNVPGLVASSAAAPNNLTEAVLYVNNNPDTYVLLINQNVSGAALTINAAGVNLLIEGIGTVRNIDNTIVINNGILTLGENIRIEGDVTLFYNADLILSENSEIQLLNLNADNITNAASLTVTPSWNGRVETLNLRGSSVNINDVIDFWLDKTIIKTTSGNLDPLAVNHFNEALNEFITDGLANQIIDDYQINSDGVLEFI